ncbi:MAG: ABC transporter permease [Euzebyales bacterium]|nr:ABC transporter permease [Euzebyales bacterium]
MSATADVVAPRLAEPVPAPRRLLGRLARSPAGVTGLFLTLVVVTVAVAAPLLAPTDPFAIVGPALSPPSPEHAMGTDALGRDVLSAVIHGARTSMLVAGGVAIIVFLVGVTVGTLGGYRGGWLDDLLMRGTEAVQVLPRFFLAIIVIAFFGPGLDRLVIVLGLTSWPLLARVIRAEVLSLRHREFVEAARSHGASDIRVIVREILPNVLPSGIALIGLLLAQVILIEAGLGFLGLGDPNAVSWGYLANEAQRFLRVAWWLSIFPGAAIFVAVLGLNLLGDALTDALGRRR